jgi:hypothetical protein
MIVLNLAINARDAMQPGGTLICPGRAGFLTMHPTVKPVALVVDAIKD